MADITINKDELLEEMTALRAAAEELALPVLRTSTGHTAAGLQYLPNVYNNFKDIITKYILLFKRDLGFVADTACAFYFFDSACGNVLAFDDVRSIETRWSVLLDCLIDSETVEYTVDTAAHMYADWSFGIHDLDNIAANIIENLFTLIEHTNALIGLITSFESTSNFDCHAAAATLSYFSDIHINACRGIRTVAQTLFAHISRYWNSYTNSSLLTYNGNNYVFYKAKMEEFIAALDDRGDYMRRKHTYIVSNTMNLYVDSAYEFNFNDMIPDIRALSDKYNDMVEVTQSMVDQVDENEDALIADQTTLESPIYDLVDLINSIIANVRGRYDYIYPPATDVIGISEYRVVFDTVRTINEEEYIDDMCLAATRAGEVNTEFARDVRDVNNQNDLTFGLYAVFIGAYGFGTAPMVVPSGAFTFVSVGGRSIPLAFNVSDTFEDATEFYNLHWGDSEEGGFNPLLHFVFADDEDGYNLARTIASYAKFVAKAAEFRPTATLNEIGYLILLLLRKMTEEEVISVLVSLGLSRAKATLLVSNAIVLLDREYASEVLGRSDYGFIEDLRMDYSVGTEAEEMAEDLADILEEDITYSTYTESTMDTEGYDEERLTDMGIIGEVA